MQQPMRLALVAAAAFALLAAVPRRAAADCPLPCSAMLCLQASTSAAVLRAEVLDVVTSPVTQLTVRVLEVRGTPRTPIDVGDELVTRTAFGFEPAVGMEVLVVTDRYTDDAVVFARVRPGMQVSCADYGHAVVDHRFTLSAPELMDATVSGECHEAVQDLGYDPPACDDTGGCAVGGGASPGGVAALSLLLVVAGGLLQRRWCASQSSTRSQR